jgi:hypothetical protein
VDVELAVHAPEVELDRLRAQEELGRDLAVLRPSGDREGDPQLLGGELVGPVDGRALDRAGRAKLGAHPFTPRRGAELLEDLQGVSELIPGGDAATGAVQARSVDEQVRPRPHHPRAHPERPPDRASASAAEIAAAWGSGSSATRSSIGDASSPRAANGNRASDSTPAAVATAICPARSPGLLEQRRLADPRVAAHDQATPSTRLRPLEQRVYSLELGSPSEKHVAQA